MTSQEKRLWYSYLKKLPYNFRRQKVINIYIVDFYCDEKKLAIEIDGDQHHNTEKAVLKDTNRDKYLNQLGIKILRFTNYEIDARFENVCKTIEQSLIPIGSSPYVQ